MSGAVYPVVYDPGYTREYTTVRVETNVYATSQPDGDLVWTSVGDSFNPKSAKKVADGLVREVPKQMEKDATAEKLRLELKTLTVSVRLREGRTTRGAQLSPFRER
jgi:hypothetical protein